MSDNGINGESSLRYQRKKPVAERIDRLPPFSNEAEQAVLGCVFMDPNSIGQCVETLKNGAQEFYDLRHQTIFSTMVELWDEREPIEVITVMERLKAWDKLDSVGGIQYLSMLPDCAPSAANLQTYLDIVRERFFMRQMIRVGTDVVSRMYEFAEGDLPKALDECERDLLRATESRVSSAIPDINYLVVETMAEIESARNRTGEVTGLRTGYSDFDGMTGGLRAGNMVVIAARPSIGKTSLGMNIAEYVAIESKLPVAIFSLEMTSIELVKRMLMSRAKVNSRDAAKGFLSEEGTTNLTNASVRVAKAPIYIDDSSGLSILQLRAKARRMYQQYGIKLFVIDYLGLLNAMSGHRKFESRQQEVSDISRGVKELAKELSVPVIVLCQLNRDIEREKNRKPRLSDLRESGSIEQDADIVSFLYKPQEDDPADDTIAVNWFLAKQRNGPTGECPLTFFRSFTRFESGTVKPSEKKPTTQQEFPNG